METSRVEPRILIRPCKECFRAAIDSDIRGIPEGMPFLFRCRMHIAADRRQCAISAEDGMEEGTDRDSEKKGREEHEDHIKRRLF